MRKYRFLGFVIVLAMISMTFIICGKKSSPAGPEKPPVVEVNGTLTEYQNISILRMWGTDREKGYAHGYLLAEYILNMLNNMVGGSILDLDAKTWENSMIPAIGLFTIETRFEEELLGMLAGIKAKLGNSVEVVSIGRPLKYEDLAAIQIGPDFTNVQCSSFSGWGAMTLDGGATKREPYSGQNYQICTNHWKRKAPIACERYLLLEGQLGSIDASGGASHLTLNKAWELLEAILVNNPTHHRVIFEPKKK